MMNFSTYLGYLGEAENQISMNMDQSINEIQQLCDAKSNILENFLQHFTRQIEAVLCQKDLNERSIKRNQILMEEGQQLVQTQSTMIDVEKFKIQKINRLSESQINLWQKQSKLEQLVNQQLPFQYDDNEKKDANIKTENKNQKRLTFIQDMSKFNESKSKSLKESDFKNITVDQQANKITFKIDINDDQSNCKTFTCYLIYHKSQQKWLAQSGCDQLISKAIGQFNFHKNLAILYENLESIARAMNK